MDTTVEQMSAAELHDLLGPQGMLRGADVTERYTRDWSGDYSCSPLAVLRPSTTEQVAQILRVCRNAGFKVIPQGGHTGLVGGGTPDAPDQLVLSLERLNRIRDIDPLGMTITVEAGCILQDIKDVAQEHGCLFPLSLGAQGSCQIGGNIATNAGGLNVLRYGMTRKSVLGLEVVLPDGQLFSDLRPLHKNNTGLDLKQLFIGSEGTLGVITAATLKLYPRPRHVETIWIACESISAVMEVYRLFQREAGEMLSAFELITADCLELALDYGSNPSPLRDLASYPAHALIEVSSSVGLSLKDWVETLTGEAFETGHAVDGIIAQSESHARHFWQIREMMVEAQQKRGLHLRSDVSVPISSIADFIDTAAKVLSTELPGLLVLSYGHVGDGNIHLNALPPPGMDAIAFRPWLAPLTERLNEVVDTYGGSISAEHGIGLSKRAALATRLKSVESNLMRAVKHHLDPTQMLSPGRVLVV